MEIIKTIRRALELVGIIKETTAEDLDNVLIRGSTTMTPKQRDIWENMSQKEKARYNKKHWEDTPWM